MTNKRTALPYSILGSFRRNLLELYERRMHAHVRL
jgi:hypothetical protein